MLKQVFGVCRAVGVHGGLGSRDQRYRDEIADTPQDPDRDLREWLREYSGEESCHGPACLGGAAQARGPARSKEKVTGCGLRKGLHAEVRSARSIPRSRREGDQDCVRGRCAHQAVGDATSSSVDRRPAAGAELEADAFSPPRWPSAGGWRMTRPRSSSPRPSDAFWQGPGGPGLHSAGHPWNNGHAESFIKPDCGEKLSQRGNYLGGACSEAQVPRRRTTSRDTNNTAPASALGYLTPNEYAASAAPHIPVACQIDLRTAFNPWTTREVNATIGPATGASHCRDASTGIAPSEQEVHRVDR
ncbi:hypothetical protein FQA39_LY19406 [Lamprigera yunnana]|nr:hypothetical protein FQA39_LY19406 [Lamprigera yunnana]